MWPSTLRFWRCKATRWRAIGNHRLLQTMLRPMPLNAPPSALLDRASLFLDLDGTLVEFALSPGGIDVCDQLRGLLLSLHDRLDGRVAVISGRSLEDLSSHLRLDGLAMAGSHGLERRHADGIVEGADIPDSIAAATAETTLFARQHSLVAEFKPAGIAIHFRDRPALEDLVDRFVADSAVRHGLAVQKGSMVREIRAPGRNKGDVLRLFMSEAPFADGTPVVLGDDVTDEDAFLAAAELGGVGVLVGPERATTATYRLDDVAAVKRWLRGDEV